MTGTSGMTHPTTILTRNYLRRLETILVKPLPGSDYPALNPPYIKQEHRAGNHGLRDPDFLRLCNGVPDENRLDALAFVLNTLPAVRMALTAAYEVASTPADRLPDLSALREALTVLDRTHGFAPIR